MEGNRNAIFANLLTVGNGICGFSAVAILLKISVEDSSEVHSPQQLELFAAASWLILLGMVFDVFDGKVARLTGASSALGAQLDSLCDLVTFGLAPALMMLRLSAVAAPPVVWWQRAVWFFSLAYFLGALLRLARFTAEQDTDESEHMAFKGLPSPGAAGCVASVVLFFTYIMAFKAKELQWLSDFVAPERVQYYVAFIPICLPVLGLILGYTMVSNRLVYAHIGSRIFARRQSFDSFAYMVFGGVLLGILPEPILPVLFLGYLVYTPMKQALRFFLPARAPAPSPKSADA